MAKVLIWIGIIWLIGWIGMILCDAIRWSDPLAGALSGAIQGLFLSPFLLIVTLPAALLGWGIGSWRRLRPRRLALSFLFAAIVPLGQMGLELKARLQPGSRFTGLTGVAFPRDAKVSHCDLEGGGFADLSYTYVFTCSSAETDRLIRELMLTKSHDGGSSLGWSAGAGSTVSGDGGSWTVEEVWNFMRNFVPGESHPGGADFIELQTDASHTQVRLICGTI